MAEEKNEPVATSSDESLEVFPRDTNYLFTNIFTMTFGDNDVIIHFGVDDRGGGSGGGGRRVFPQASLVMTPRSAKILAGTLTRVVAHFEEHNAPISIPPGRFEAVEKKLAAKTEQLKQKRKTE